MKSRIIYGVFVITLLIAIGYKAYLSGEMYELEKVEHEVDTMKVIQGIYSGNGTIVTEDGNEWEIYDEDINTTEVTVIFQTYNGSVEEWKIIGITEM